MIFSVSSSSSPAHLKAHAMPAHLAALGLSRPPFPVTPDDEQAFFFSARLNEKYAELKHFIGLRKGFMLVSGDVGVGKTTLTHLLLGHLQRENVRTALIFNTFLQEIELFRAINRDFRLTPQEDTLEGHLQCLNAFLLETYEAGHNCVLIIDDAQRLSINSLELIRQLSNLETAHDKLLQIVLVAQPEIMETLDRFDLRQLRSRIALHVELLPLTMKEIDHYLYHRLSLAGSNSTLAVSTRAMRDLFRATGGFPRLIHLVMDRCLFGLVASNARLIDVRLMRQAIEESGLRQATAKPGWGRRLGRVGPVLALSVAGILLTGLGFTASEMVPKNQTPPATAEASDGRWRSFLDDYPALHRVVIPELRENSPAGMDSLGKELAPYRWLPVLIGSAATKSCKGFQAYPLHSTTGQQGSLALFQTDLPVTPIPFSQHDEAVKLLQEKLSILGYLSKNEMDGVMGMRTAFALAKFQKAKGLVSTGQLDVNSDYALECALSQEPVPGQ